jgi:molybdate transport system regulatory protein
MEKLLPRFKIWLSTENVEGVFGDGKWRLLKAVDSTGSLKAASNMLDISYRKAWGDLKKAEHHLGLSLVQRQRGGKTGGKTSLTKEGKKWVTAYAKFRNDVKKTVDKSFKNNIRAKAFTLIELMVVVSVISLLLCLTLPSLNRARVAARQTLCQNRLRQWSLAFELYVNVNNDYYPHTDGRDRTDSNPITEADLADYYSGWIDVLPPLMEQTPWRDHDYWNKPGTNTIFQCPSARLAPDELYKYKPQRTGYFSYAMNSCLELDDNCWPPYKYEGDNWQMPSFLKKSFIKSPSRLVLLFDQLLDPTKGYGGDEYNASAGKYCGSYPKAFSARHAKKKKSLGGNILYSDSHIEWKQTVWKEYWPEDLEVPPAGDLDWYPY